MMPSPKQLRLLALALMAFAPVTSGAQHKTSVGLARIKQGAERMAKATLAGDWPTVADSTYGKVAEQMGGREKMLADMKAVTAELKGQGFSIKSYTIGDPSEPVSEGSRMFSVLPVRMELSGEKGRLHSKSYLLAISDDKGKSWKFVDGSGVANKHIRVKVFPKLPAKLKLPEIQAPVFEPSK